MNLRPSGYESNPSFVIGYFLMLPNIAENPVISRLSGTLRFKTPPRLDNPMFQFSNRFVRTSLELVRLHADAYCYGFIQNKIYALQLSVSTVAERIQSVIFLQGLILLPGMLAP